MGGLLSEPITTKYTTTGISDNSDNKYIKWVASEMQGWRRAMEDANIALINFDNSNYKSNSLFGVFDGHGGDTVAKLCNKYLPLVLKDNQDYKNGNYVDALTNTFLSFDKMLLNPSEFNKFNVDDESNTNIGNTGTTAIVCLLTSTTIFAANIGDSRAMLSRNGIVVDLSYDHKPTDEKEFERIKNAGGFVVNSRVNGGINLSRAFGDFDYKNNKSKTEIEQCLIALPDIISQEIDDTQDEFMVLACDGIIDVLTNQDLVTFIRKLIKQQKPLTKICEIVMNKCLAPYGGGIGTDNMTIQIIRLPTSAANNLFPEVEIEEEFDLCTTPEVSDDEYIETTTIMESTTIDVNSNTTTIVTNVDETITITEQTLQDD